MKHSFIPSQIDINKCSVCHFDLISHGDKAECDCCVNIGPVELMYGNMRMCPACILREAQTSQENNTPEKQNERVNSMNNAMTRALEQAKAIDNGISVKSDLFNAATVSIIELKATIDANSEIVNKPYELAKTLTERFNHFKSVIFEANETIVEAGNNQKAIQSYLNTLANQLKTEEREKLKINDINYQPVTGKIVKPRAIKTVATSSKKLDKAELRKAAAELGISEFMVQSVVVARGITVEQAVVIIKASIEAAKLVKTS